VDAAQPEVVGGHVEHHADVALVEAEPRAQQPAARRLQHRDVDVGLERMMLAANGPSCPLITSRFCR
jgi:hypothetical protein